MSIESHKDLIVWKKSIALVTEVYQLTQTFPADEKFGLVSQMRRAAVSVPSNIAEGSCRGSRKDYRKFILIAYGSCTELETQLLIARNLKFITTEQYAKIVEQTVEILKMLSALARKLQQ